MRVPLSRTCCWYRYWLLTLLVSGLAMAADFYDRTMTGMRSRQDILAVGVAYAAQECEAVPCGETDAVLDWIVTETEAIRVVKSTSHRQEPK